MVSMHTCTIITSVGDAFAYVLPLTSCFLWHLFRKRSKFTFSPDHQHQGQVLIIDVVGYVAGNLFTGRMLCLNSMFLFLQCRVWHWPCGAQVRVRAAGRESHPGAPTHGVWQAREKGLFLKKKTLQCLCLMLRKTKKCFGHLRENVAKFYLLKKYKKTFAGTFKLKIFARKFSSPQKWITNSNVV